MESSSFLWLALLFASACCSVNDSAISDPLNRSYDIFSSRFLRLLLYNEHAVSVPGAFQNSSARTARIMPCKDPCIPDPCHAERCEVLGEASYKCHCSSSSGRYGVNCQHVNKCLTYFLCPSGYDCAHDEVTHTTTCINLVNERDNVEGSGSLRVKNCLFENPCMNNGECASAEKGSFTCSCPFPFGGLVCEKCLCKNGGVCSFGEKKSVCICPPSCSTESDCSRCVSNFCENHPYICSNGGTCRDSPSNSGNFTCDCHPNCLGETCATCSLCTDLPNDYCKNGGVCIDVSSFSVFCECPPGITGQNCETIQISNSNYCANDSLCENGGTCETDTRGNYICHCTANCHGRKCEHCQTPCSVLPDTCMNGGSCHNLANGSYVCDCLEHCFGEHCQICDKCIAQNDFCMNGGTCNNSACHCTKRCHGTRCETCDNYCDLFPLICGSGTCVNEPEGRYTCVCSDACRGYNCETCRVDYCAENPGTCLNSGTCLSDPEKNFTCQCLDHCSGPHCETCGNLDPCLPNPCKSGGICESKNGTFWCNCSSEACSAMVCKNCSANLCNDDNPCIYGGECLKHEGWGYCQCLEDCFGYLCEKCEEPDICSTDPCNGEPCTTLAGTNDFQCNCATPGLYGKFCQHHSGCNEPSICSNGGTCVHNKTTHITLCNCTEGYRGLKCDLKDPCLNKVCWNGGFCVSDTEGSPRCECSFPFGGNDCQNCLCTNGGNCSVENEDKFQTKATCVCPRNCFQPDCSECASFCEAHAEVCHNGGTCVDGDDPSSFICNCPSHCQGETCSICSSCQSLPPNYCGNGHCVDLLDGSFLCKCRLECTGERCQTCSPDLGYCARHPFICQNNGKCIENATAQQYACECQSGCEGRHCEVCPHDEDNYCKTHPGICLNGGTCESGKNHTFICRCTGNCYGSRCSTCQNSDTCMLNLCLNGGLCITVEGEAQCQCMSGCSGRFCESCDRTPSPCDDDPCMNGCVCEASCHHSHGYLCKGGQGYLGKNCEIEAPKVLCLEDQITVKVPLAFTQEIASIDNDVLVFVSQTPMGQINTFDRNCTSSAISGSNYVISMPLPFIQCGSTVMLASHNSTAGGQVVENTVWMNHFNVTQSSLSLDMPVPVASFRCLYPRQYSVLASIRPVLPGPIITVKGDDDLVLSITICKIATCPGTCPDEQIMNSGAVYIVGQRIYISFAAKLPSVANIINTKPALITTLNWLAFSCNGSAENPVNVVELVANGCISNNTTAANLSLKITRSGVGQTVCLSFLMPRMKACDEEFFIHANIQLCEQNRRLKCSENQKVFRCYDSHGGKLRKRRDSTRSGLSQTVVVGPIYAIEGAKGLSEMDIIAELRNHSDTYFESTFNNTVSTSAPWEETVVLVFLTTTVGVCLLSITLLLYRLFAARER